jgi:hypothetical protein
MSLINELYCENGSNPEDVRTAKCFMSEPLAWLYVRVGISGRLIGHLDLHFVNFDSTGRVVGDVEFAGEGRELFKLKFVDYDALLVG